jgi:hypothetical protein
MRVVNGYEGVWEKGQRRAAATTEGQSKKKKNMSKCENRERRGDR